MNALPKISWLTDIHLDHLRDEVVEDFFIAVNADDTELVLISGDISTAKRLTGHLLKAEEIVQKPLRFVLGNHDFYGRSVATVQASMQSGWTVPGSNVQYLPCAPIQGDGWAIVGVDGFADGLAGHVDWHRGPVLSDWVHIRELLVAHAAGRDELVQAYTRIARAEADKLQTMLYDACIANERVLVVTHCPPWPQAAWHRGAQSDELFLPWFSSQTIGGTIEMVAQNFPKTKITVICGHTHGRGYVRIRENVECFTGWAEYGDPCVQDWDWTRETEL